MLWFYSRDRDTLHLETRYDNDARQYVAIVTYSDGHRETTRYSTGEAFHAWLVSFEKRLAQERWRQDGAPTLLPDGWPDTKPFQ